MELFIQIKNGLPFEHPIFGDNFKEVFPDIDTNNLPPEFAKFTRHEQPVIGAYEVYQGVTYEADESGGFCDVHHVRNMTESERTEKQTQIMQAWAQADGFPSWQFDADKCIMKPPVPCPDNGKTYKWDETTVSWVEIIISDETPKV